MTPNQMRAARVHDTGEPMVIENVDVPASVRPTDVLVKIEACGIVQNLKNVLKNFDEMAPDLPLPKLPAIFGLDAAGTIETVGSQVTAFAPGDRVYVNPGRHCGACRACMRGDFVACDSFALNGYFGLGKKSQRMFEDYPYGGLCEYMTAPQYSLVRLPSTISFETATRLGYLGTAYRALVRAAAGPGKTVLINGITGTLGLGAVALALAMGATKILGTARNEDLFARVKALSSPGRIEILASGSEKLANWVDRVTDGHGLDIAVDALGPNAPSEPMREAIDCLNRGGCLVDIGAVTEDIPINMFRVMSNDVTLIGSSWFTTPLAQQMVDMTATGQLDLSFYEHLVSPLEAINEAIEDTDNRSGGFSNYVIKM